MEAQAQPVQTVEDILREIKRGDLAHAFERDVAQIVERNAGEAAQAICQHQRQRDHGGFVARRGHRVDSIFISKGQGEGDCLGGEDKSHRGDDPAFEPRIVTRPQIGNEPPQRVPAICL